MMSVGFLFLLGLLLFGPKKTTEIVSTEKNVPAEKQMRVFCPLCGKPCSLENCVTNSQGRAVHKECIGLQSSKGANPLTQRPLPRLIS